jgi:ribosomal protein L11
LLEVQDVLDMMVDAGRAAMGEDVGSDLAQRGLEENELTIVDSAAGLLAQKFD